MTNCRMYLSSCATQAESHTRTGGRMVVEGSFSASMLYEAYEANETHVITVHLPGYPG